MFSPGNFSPEDSPHHLQTLLRPGLAQQELRRLREGEEGETDEEAGGGRDQGEDPPAVPAQLVGDDGPGQPSHGDVSDHPERGQHAECPAPLGAGLELCEICPDERNTAAHPESDQMRIIDITAPVPPSTHPSPLMNLSARKVG